MDIETSQAFMDGLTPLNQAHQHGVQADEAYKLQDYDSAKHYYVLAAEKYREACQIDVVVSNRSTLLALETLARHHADRAEYVQMNFLNNVGAQNAFKAAMPKEKSSQDTTTDTEKSLMEAKVMEGTQQVDLREEKNETERSKDSESILEEAEDEINELWQKLSELGLPRGSRFHAPSHLAFNASRHFSSSLGDSFLMLPTKGREGTGVAAPTLDGHATLRAAADARIRNQRTRLLEHQTPAHRFHSAGQFRNDLVSSGAQPNNRTRNPSTKALVMEMEKQKETINHQKYEIMRLLQTVKTLSTENANLLKECDDRASLQEANKQINESMRQFKQQYHEKFATLKRALEEWRRQKEKDEGMHTPNSPVKRRSQGAMDGSLVALNAKLEEAMESNRRKDAQLLKYEQWYNQLKVGARAKQQERKSSVTSSSASSHANTSSQHSTASFPVATASHTASLNHTPGS